MAKSLRTHRLGVQALAFRSAKLLSRVGWGVNPDSTGLTRPLVFSGSS